MPIPAPDPSLTLPDAPEPRPWRAAWPSTAEAIAAVARLMATAEKDRADRAAVGLSLVAEARALLEVQHVVLLSLPAGRGRVSVVAADDEPRERILDWHPVLDELRDAPEAPLVLDVQRASELSQLLIGGAAGAALLLPVRSDGPLLVLVLLDQRRTAFAPETIAAAEALAGAGASALARRIETEQAARRIAGHLALTRAAKNLHESLDLDTVLRRIAQEATRILDGDYTAVFRGSKGGVVLGSASGLPPESLGIHVAPGQGLTGRVLQSERSTLTNDYLAEGPPAHPSFANVQSCLAVPMFWGGELRGVLSVAYERDFHLTEEHLRLLETFAELAAIACTNASAHAGLSLVARTDALTGCLSHAALHESLGREIGRAERSPAPRLSLVMIDLDEFKSVNERHGHLIGDEVLRRAGHALRQATRPYDVAARYGGDEFALVAVEADEAEAAEIGMRATEQIAMAIGDLCEGPAGRATAGVAEWEPGVTPAELIVRADRALLFGKHEGDRGGTILHSTLPDWFRPGRFTRHAQSGAAGAPPMPLPPVAQPVPDEVRPTDQRLRDRTRQLAAVNALAARMTAMTDPGPLLALATADLRDILDASSCAILRVGAGGELVPEAGSPSPDPSGVAARCLREGRPILVTNASARARLAVPLTVDGSGWGAIEAVASGPGAFDDDDLRLAEAVAAHTGAALWAAQRYAELRRAYDAAVASRGAPGPSLG